MLMPVEATTTELAEEEEEGVGMLPGVAGAERDEDGIPPGPTRPPPLPLGRGGDFVERGEEFGVDLGDA